jgi:protoporphyrinogen oxidase
VIEIECKNKLVYFSDKSKISYNSIINTMPINDIFNICNFEDKDILTTSNNLKYLNLIVSAVVIDDPDELIKLPDWFYIYDEDIEMSRVKNISKVIQDTSRKVALQFETFRRNDEKYNYEELLKKIEKDCCKILPKIDKKNISFKHVFTKYSYVVSCINTEKDRLNLIRFLKSNDIYSCGLYGTWNYMWSDKSFFSGVETGNLLIKKT